MEFLYRENSLVNNKSLKIVLTFRLPREFACKICMREWHGYVEKGCKGNANQMEKCPM